MNARLKVTIISDLTSLPGRLPAKQSFSRAEQEV
jgi:hypothetical protein